MAISDALRYQLNTGGSADTLYGIIRDFLATNPDAASTQAQMRQYGISAEDVANATGGKSGGLLSGNILAGASWNSLNTALPEQLTAATGQATSNYAVGGATTADTLTQLNTFLAGGGQFDPNSTVYLQTGGVDFLQGVDKGTIKDNISEIVKTLGDQGVNVVLTGSPYAKSIDDVINNNFDPKVDSLFTEIAKENKNVALVGTQGEILQNKNLLVDALHTNAEGTAIYNQSVIDALSQFKNEVPSSTPEAIAQVQQTNTVATTPPIITQAAASPAVAQTLVDTIPAVSSATTKASANVIPTARGTVIEGDNIEEKIAGVPQVVYETRVDPNNTANWQTVNPKTGEVINSGTFAGGGDKGLLAAAAPVIGLAASTVGLPGLTGLLGGLTGTTGSTLAGLTGATIGGGTTALAGGTGQDILKAALLGGAASYGASALDNYLATGSTADVGLTERQFAVQDAKNLASQGLSTSQISDTLTAGGYNDITVQRAISSITGTPVPSLPIPNTVNVTGTTTPAVSTGGLLGGLVTPTTQATTPTTETLNVTGATQPQMVDQATLGLVTNQLTSNLGTQANLGATNNLANVQVTGKGLLSGADTNAALAGVIAGLPSVTTPVTQAGTVNVTGDKLATTQEITNAILATVPTVTVQQAQTQAEVLVTSGQNLTTNDLVSAVSAVSPNITPTVAEQIITSSNSDAIQPVVSALVSTVTPTTPSNLATVQVTGDRVASTQEIANAVIATVPNVTPQQAQTQAEVIVTSGQNLKVSDLVGAISAVSPNITPNVAEQIITSNRPITNQEIVSALAGTVTAVNQPIAQQTITSTQAAQTQEIASAVTALIPNVTPAQANTIAETVINSGRPITAQEVVNTAAAVVPALAAPSVAAPSVATQTIIGERPSSITDVTAGTIPLIQPSTPLTVPQLIAPATTPAAPATTPASTSNPLLNAAGSLGLSSLLGSAGANLISGGLGTAGNLLQMQTSREAAQRAQAMIDAETKAAKDAAQFRPIGMTTRFGTSQFGFDPVTGRLSSAGYNLTPDVKAQQDRFMALSNQGLTQAEQAQGQFAPLQTGAQRLFGLGNQYLAQSPQDVAQNYLNQQMSLLQPGREQELAALQNRLQQQGRGGLSVAQGGTMGATTPELQALYNARATQEAQLAANAQQAGQRDVLFGAGLLGQGSQAMGQYYGGQQAAYAPYTAALGQAQTLETLGQQPYNMGVNLGQIGSQAGFNVGQLGLKGAQISAGLATSADATRNLLAQGLTAAGNPNAMVGQSLSGLFGGGLQSAFSGTGLGASGFGTGLAYGNQDLGLFL